MSAQKEPSRLDRFMSIWGESIRYGKELIQKPAVIDERRDSKLIVMVVVSALRADPRVERAARKSVERGYNVVVIAPDISNPTHAEQPLDWGPNVSFDLTPYESCSYVMKPPYVWNDVIFEKVCEYKPALIHANDLFTTLICLRAGQKNGVPVVVDFHEWHAENVQWDNAKQAWGPHPWIERVMFRFFERVAMWRAASIITVCNSIAHELERMSWKPRGFMKIIRNIPPLDGKSSRPYPPLKEQLGLPEDSFVIMYQGGLGATRALEPIIRGLAYAPDVTFVIRGPGMDQLGPGYREVAEKAGVSDRLVLADGVPSRDVVAAAKGADVGLWNLPNISKNFYYALPNKIWEYLAADLPVLVSNFPEARAIAIGQRVGLTFEPTDPRNIGAAMQKMATDKAFYDMCKQNVPAALANLDVATEWSKLVDIYDEVIERFPATTPVAKPKLPKTARKPKAPAKAKTPSKTKAASKPKAATKPKAQATPSKPKAAAKTKVSSKPKSTPAKKAKSAAKPRTTKKTTTAVKPKATASKTPSANSKRPKTATKPASRTKPNPSKKAN